MIYDVDGAYTSLDNLEYYKELHKGTYIIWFYVCQERSEIQVDQVVFSCSSNSQIKIIHVNEDSSFKIAKKLLIEGIKIKDEEKIKKDANIYMAVYDRVATGTSLFCRLIHLRNLYLAKVYIF